MCKILKVSSLLGLLAFCAAEGMKINASSEPEVAKESGPGVKLKISEPLTLESKERMLKLTNLNDGTVTNYKEDEILKQIYKGRVGQLTFNDGRVEYFTGENIPENWFKGNTSLESIVIPPTVTSIGCNAFDECRQLQEVILGSQLQKIGVHAFGYSDLNTVTIPNSVKIIEGGAFAGNKLSKVVFLGDPSKINIAQDAFPENVTRGNDSEE